MQNKFSSKLVVRYSLWERTLVISLDISGKYFFHGALIWTRRRPHREKDARKKFLMTRYKAFQYISLTNQSRLYRYDSIGNDMLLFQKLNAFDI